MPAWPSLAEFGLPVNVAIGLGPSLPQGEIAHVFLLVLVRIHTPAGASLQLTFLYMGEFAIAREGVHFEIHRATGLVGITAFEEALDQRHHFRDMLSGCWVMLGPLDIEGVQILEKSLGVKCNVFREGGIRLPRSVNRLIIDVSQIHHLRDAVALVDQIPAQDIVEHESPEVADVGVVVHRGSAGIDAHLSRMNGLEFFLAARQGIKETYNVLKSL